MIDFCKSSLTLKLLPNPVSDFFLEKVKPTEFKVFSLFAVATF